MKQSKIDKLCSAINEKRGHVYPSIGYIYYADVKGDGIKRPRSVWQIISAHGGVVRAYEYSGNPRQIVAALQQTLNSIGSAKHV